MTFSAFNTVVPVRVEGQHGGVAVGLFERGPGLEPLWLVALPDGEVQVASPASILGDRRG